MRWPQKIRYVFACVSLLAQLVIPIKVYAHDAAFNLKYTDGNKLIVGTYNVHEIEAGTTVTYNWRVYDTSGAPVTYKTIEIIVEHDKTKIYQQTFKASQYDETNWKYNFSEAGQYTIRTLFTDTGTHIASGEFPIEVAKSEQPSAWSAYINPQTTLAFISGGAVVLAVQALRRMNIDWKKYLRKSSKR